ncbi:hypothetical protein ON010_g17356 [Phytophthora cinnamomi]|nr:hypothetical protein ON010_g17356 [Phytophthora cinnamomi]
MPRAKGNNEIPPAAFADRRRTRDANHLWRVVESEQPAMATLSLERWPEKGPSYLATGKLLETLARVPYSQSIIDRIFLSAAERGNGDMVKILVEHISMGFGNALIPLIG